MYTFHKPARWHFICNRIYVGKIDKQCQADLAYMARFERENCGHQYVFIVIDVFLKYALSVFVKSNYGKSVRDAFKSVLKSANRRTPVQL